MFIIEAVFEMEGKCYGDKVTGLTISVDGMIHGVGELSCCCSFRSHRH